MPVRRYAVYEKSKRREAARLVRDHARAQGPEQTAAFLTRSGLEISETTVRRILKGDRPRRKAAHAICAILNGRKA